VSDVPSNETAVSESTVSESRRRLLDAGLSLLAEQDLQHWLRSLTARAVARRAQRTTGAFYAQWACQQDFVSDLVTYAFDPDELMSAWAVDQQVRWAASRAGSPSELVALVAGEAIDGQLDTSNFTAVLALLSRHRDPVVRAGIADSYRVVEGAHVEAYRKYFGARYGLEPVAPLTWEGFGAVIAAVIDGATIRHLIEPESFPRDRFPLLVLSIATTWLRPIGSERTVADIAGGFDRLVAEAQEVRRGNRPATPVKSAHRNTIRRRVAVRGHTDRRRVAHGAPSA
jgi:AcrR family transcriptional regulator